jgi:hypothetical protein
VRASRFLLEYVQEKTIVRMRLPAGTERRTN